MTDEQVQRLAAALRAQASGFSQQQAPSSPDPQAAQTWSGMPAWRVLALAVLLGGMAGSVAGMISSW